MATCGDDALDLQVIYNAATPELVPLEGTGMCKTSRTTVATTSPCAHIIIELPRCARTHPCHHPMLSHPLSPRPIGDRLMRVQHSTASSYARRRSLPEAVRWPARSIAAHGRVGGARVATRKREAAQGRGTAASRLVASLGLSMAVQLCVAMPMRSSAHVRCPMHVDGMENLCRRPVASYALVIT